MITTPKNAHLLPELTVSMDTPLIEAIAILTRTARKILLVLAEDRLLKGVITDYDVRTAILNHVPFDVPVRDIMMAHPSVGRMGMSRTEILDLMRTSRCAQIPLLDQHGRVVDIHFLNEYIESDGHAPVAVIMAGGLGKRLRPMTAEVPKPLLPVAGRPVLFILLDQMISEGFERIYVTVNYKREMIKAAVADVPKYRHRVVFVDEDQPLGTAGSLSLLPERPQTDFVVANADLLTNISLTEMLERHIADGNMVTMATREEKHTIPYGVIEIEGSRITGLLEKPEHVYYLNTGVYVASPAILDMIPRDHFMDMTDVVQLLLQQDLRVGSYPLTDYWLDIGNREHYERAQVDYVRHFSGQDEAAP